MYKLKIVVSVGQTTKGHTFCLTPHLENITESLNARLLSQKTIFRIFSQIRAEHYTSSVLTTATRKLIYERRRKKNTKKKQNKEVTLVQVAEAWLRLKQDFDSYIFELSL